MGHGHHHAHGHPHHHAHEQPGAHEAGGHGIARKLAIALGLTGLFFCVEVAFGFWTGSLSLLSDAGHMLGDSGALTLSLVAQHIAGRPRTRVHTFGFRRAEILAALVNGLALLVTAIVIVVEAIGRLGDPPSVRGGPMLAVACCGLLVNVIAAFVLSHGEQNANVRGALAHVISDALGSLAAIAAALFILGLGWNLADPLASLAISLLVATSAIRLLRETVSVLMESTPLHIDLAALEREVKQTPGVAEVHDLHAWAISDGFVAATVHVVLDGSAHGTDVARLVGERIRRKFGITHTTVQPEAPSASTQVVPIERLTRKAAPPESERG